MTETILPLQAARVDGTLRLPVGSGPNAPLALLSLRPLGSMRYLHDKPNSLRDVFFRSRGIRPERVLAVELVHSRLVLFPSGPEDVRGRRADGLIVERGPWVPTVTVADCMPIWIRHEASGAFGVLHSGWRGTGILESAVRGLAERYGASASEIDVVLGPAIGPCCYTVPRDRAELFTEKFGAEAVRFSGDSWRLDLAAANLGIARRLGLRSLTRIDGCTSCEPDLGSYRREGPTGFTRMVAAAVDPAPDWGAA